MSAKETSAGQQRQDKQPLRLLLYTNKQIVIIVVTAYVLMMMRNEKCNFYDCCVHLGLRHNQVHQKCSVVSAG